MTTAPEAPTNRVEHSTAVVAEMTAQREAQPDLVMTIQAAIGKALLFRQQPETVLDDKQAKQVIDTLLSALEASTCYFKAVQKGEAVFVLRQQDRAAPHTIATWANIAEQHGCSAEKVADARAIAGRWEKQDLTTTKWPT